MGRYCWMCGRVRPNEAFRGRGRDRCTCGRCRRRLRQERERIEATRNVVGFIKQRNISARNIACLEQLCVSSNADVREKAALVLQVARLKPRRRKRIGFLAKNAPDLLAALARHGLVHVTPVELWDAPDPYDEIVVDVDADHHVEVCPKERAEDLGEIPW